MTVPGLYECRFGNQGCGRRSLGGSVVIGFHVDCSLHKLLKGGYIGDYIGEYYRGHKGGY